MVTVAFEVSNSQW